MTVWVSDPTEARTEATSEWDFIGSFVFLVEELGEFRWPMSWFFSGISALRLVTDMATDPAIVETGMYRRNGREPLFSRWDTSHPVEKLRTIGGAVGSPRRVEAVYKVAYMSEEITHIVGGPEVRVNDILAYPLYVIEP